MAIYSLHVGRVGRSTHAPGTAAAHARYILRRNAASAVLSEHMPEGCRGVQGWLNDQEISDRKNARVIEKIMVALPIELHPLQRQKLVREYCGRITKGRAPWLAAIHDKGKDASNPHAHIIIRDRDIETGKRVAELSEKGSCKRLRKLWEVTANEALARAGQKARIDSGRKKNGKAGRHRGIFVSYRPEIPKGELRSRSDSVRSAWPKSEGSKMCLCVTKTPLRSVFRLPKTSWQGGQGPPLHPLPAFGHLPNSRDQNPPLCPR